MGALSWIIPIVSGTFSRVISVVSRLTPGDRTLLADLRKSLRSGDPQKLLSAFLAVSERIVELSNSSSLTRASLASLEVDGALPSLQQKPSYPPPVVPMMGVGETGNLFSPELAKSQGWEVFPYEFARVDEERDLTSRKDDDGKKPFDAKSVGPNRADS